LGDLGVDGRIILKCILNITECDGVWWIQVAQVESSGGIL